MFQALYQFFFVQHRTFTTIAASAAAGAFLFHRWSRRYEDPKIKKYRAKLEQDRIEDAANRAAEARARIEMELEEARHRKAG